MMILSSRLVWRTGAAAMQPLLDAASTTTSCCCFPSAITFMTRRNLSNHHHVLLSAASSATTSSATTTSTATAAATFLANVVDTLVEHQSLALAAAYLVGANVVYLARRAYLRRMTIRQLWKIRTLREPGVSIPLYLTFLLVWQTLVIIFPIVEPMARFGWNRVCFFYSYPNASGCGIILEPRQVQHLAQSQRTKHQIRFDWHRFSLNVGNIGREGYRHPPSIERNLPHIDYPKRGLKHWPWRRRHHAC